MQISLSDHFTYQKLLRFVAPSILMMIITSIYSIVDGFFVSNFVGKNSFAALNLIFPVIMALAAVGFMIGTGGSALIAKTLGEGKPREANEIFSMLVIVLAAGGAILSGVCIVFLRPISFAVGATDLTIDDCVLYGRVLLAALPFFMLQNSFQSFLATAEKPHFGLRVTVFAGLTNMVLDFLLVYVFRLGFSVRRSPRRFRRLSARSSRLSTFSARTIRCCASRVRALTSAPSARPATTARARWSATFRPLSSAYSITCSSWRLPRKTA